MFKAIGFVIKLALFSALVLVLGNYFGWGGKTVSDQLRTGLAAVERSEMVNGVKDWAGDLVGDVRKDGTRKLSPARKGSPEESVASTERQKLRALIRELNSAK